MNILLTGAWGQAKEHMASLEAMGHEVAFLQMEWDPLPCEAAWPQMVVGNGIFLHHAIEEFERLRYVQLTSAGFDRMPMDYARAHGIEVKNARGVYSVPMAEFALGGVLQLYKQMAGFAQNQRSHTWEKQRNLQELYGKTVLIIGCGSVGTECAKRFKAFGTTVLGIDALPREDAAYNWIARLSHLDELLGRADVVVLTVPLTSDTQGLLDARRLSFMKPGSLLVNISRGRVVDEAALTQALETRLGGAVLDVFEQEPLPAASPLWDMPNVIVTPHNSFAGEGNLQRLSDVVMTNISDITAREHGEEVCTS